MFLSKLTFSFFFFLPSSSTLFFHNIPTLTLQYTNFYSRRLYFAMYFWLNWFAGDLFSRPSLIYTCFLLQIYGKYWSTTRDIRDNYAHANLAIISPTRIKIDLQYFISYNLVFHLCLFPKRSLPWNS